MLEKKERVGRVISGLWVPAWWISSNPLITLEPGPT